MSDFLSGLLGGGRRGGGGMGGMLKTAAIGLLLHQLMKNSGRGGAMAGGGGGLGGLLGGLLGGGGGMAGRGAPMGGGLGGMLGGGGGAAAGGGLGGLLGGLGGLLGGLRGQGLSQHVDSWVSAGPNQPVDPRHLAAAFDPQELDEAARQAGTDRGTLLNELSRVLPDFVDRMTPQGRVPQDEQELHQASPGGLDGLLGSLFGGGGSLAADDAPEAGAGARGGGPSTLYGDVGGAGASAEHATGRGAGLGDTGMPRFSDEPPGPDAGRGDVASGFGGPPLPRGGDRS